MFPGNLPSWPHAWPGWFCLVPSPTEGGGNSKHPQLDRQSVRSGADQAGVESVHALQGLMCAALDNPAVIEDENLVAVADGAQAVGHQDAGTAAPPQVRVDALLGDVGEGAGGFVKVLLPLALRPTRATRAPGGTIRLKPSMSGGSSRL